MDPAKDEALAAIDRAVEWVRRQREAGWPPLSVAYLARIEKVERLQRNQSGADKSWVWDAFARDCRRDARLQRD